MTHIHIGYANPNIDKSLMILKYIDMFVGVPSVIYDKDTERRKLYGKAGCFRLQSWGVEYRVLSSYWLDNEVRITFIWNQIEWALTNFGNETSLIDGHLIQSVINNNNLELAHELITHYDLISPKNYNLDKTLL